MERLNKAKWCLLGFLIVIIMFVAGSIFLPNGITNTVKWIANNELTYKLRGASDTQAGDGGTLMEMIVEQVGISQINLQPVVILREKLGELYLPIQIGFAEANSITVILEGSKIARPLTADLLCSVLDQTKAIVSCIVINDLRDNTFYADIIVYAEWKKMEIDARPSDAIAIALRMQVPIYVEKSVFDKAGIYPEPTPQEA